MKPTGILRAAFSAVFLLYAALAFPCPVFSETADGRFRNGKNVAAFSPAAAEREAEAETRRSRRRRNLLAALAVVGAYLVIYLLGRVLGTNPDGTCSAVGWLLGSDPRQLSYLYGWLLRQKLFWAALLISALPALWGKYRFSATASVGFALGLALGELAGPNPAGAPWGHGHDGWAIWGGCFLLSLAMGGVLERLSRRGL